MSCFSSNMNYNAISDDMTTADFQLFSEGSKYMDIEKKVMDVMKKAGEPLNAGKIAELSGIDRKEVDKAMKKLKTEGKIVSPKRCFWEPC